MIEPKATHISKQADRQLRAWLRFQQVHLASTKHPFSNDCDKNTHTNQEQKRPTTNSTKQQHIPKKTMQANQKSEGAFEKQHKAQTMSMMKNECG